MATLKKYAFLLIAIIYLPSLTNFFSGDDWFHLRIIQVDTFSQFLNFFSFEMNPQTATFYRPVPTQLFFFIFYKLFGLASWPYHIFVLLCFGYSIFLVYKYSKLVFRNQSGATIASLVYGISVSNFTRLYFLSAFQEISLVIFSLLSLISFPKSRIRSLCFFILALMSKETAVVLPILIFLTHWRLIKKQSLQDLLGFAIILFIYLYFRLKVFSVVVGDSYNWDFSITKTANTLMWYVLWSFGAPELLVDYIGSGLRPIPRFFSDYPIWWIIITVLTLCTLITCGILFFSKIKKINHHFLMSAIFFLVAITPVIFLPNHKFALELGLPLVGFALAISWLVSNRQDLFSRAFIFLYLSLNLSMNFLTYTRHYSVSRADISKKVYNYFQRQFPTLPPNQSFVFINDYIDQGSTWGQSKQISQSLSNKDFFRVVYHLNDPKVYYEDMLGKNNLPSSSIQISSKQFLQL